jgi:replication initiation protein RepC
MDHITTPFGRRTLSLGMVAAQVAARDVEGKAAHKWKTFRWMAECKDALGITDRDLVVLNALLTCLPETAMTAGDLVVFPSNKALALRSHGMAETTLRRHLGALVHAGLIVRRDSPNGKRYARKDGAGEIEVAYGFDLSPMLARAEEFENLAAEVAAEQRRAAFARERVTLYRRDIAKMIEAGAAAGGGDAWDGHREAFSTLCYRLPRRVTPEIVAPLVDALHALAVTVSTALEGLVSNHSMAGNDVHSGAQIENSNPDPIIDLDPPVEKAEARVEKALPLSVVLRACPDIAMYDKGGIQSWHDLVTTAELVRGMLGISTSAWQDATATMGEAGAAIVVAGILQRAEAITSPGGYLRGLTAKSRAGKFSAWSMMMALLRAQSPISKSMLGGGGWRSVGI